MYQNIKYNEEFIRRSKSFELESTVPQLLEASATGEVLDKHGCRLFQLNLYIIL